MTSRPPPCPTPSFSFETFIFVISISNFVSVRIFNSNWQFWNFLRRHRPRPPGQTDRHMLFDYSRHPWQMHPRNSPTLANASSEIVILGKKELVILGKKELVILDKKSAKKCRRTYNSPPLGLSVYQIPRHKEILSPPPPQFHYYMHEVFTYIISICI